MKADLNLK